MQGLPCPQAWACCRPWDDRGSARQAHGAARHAPRHLPGGAAEDGPAAGGHDDPAGGAGQAPGWPSLRWRSRSYWSSRKGPPFCWMAKIHAGLPGPEMGARPPMMSAMPPGNPMRGMDPRGPLPPGVNMMSSQRQRLAPPPGEDGRKEFPISWSSATVFKRI